MAARLGEMLVEAGMLTPAQLEDVLKSQAALGGRLGTNLVEMGLIEERELLYFLREKLEIACVMPADLEEVPEEVIALIPRELAHKHHVLPVSLHNKRLTVAMADPNDFHGLDEIGFVTGLVIVPCVATERSLDLALERYYGITRTLSYIPVDGGLRSRAGRGDRQAQGAQHAVPLELMEETRLSGRVPVPELAQKLAVVEKWGEVVELLLDYVAGEFDRGAFLAVSGGKVTGVKAIALGRPVPGFSAYCMPLERSAVINTVLVQKSFHVGKLPEAEAEARLQESLGGASSAPAALLPLAVDSEVVALLYVDDQGGRVRGGLCELQKVVEKGALAFKMLALRKKIAAC